MHAEIERPREGALTESQVRLQKSAVTRSKSIRSSEIAHDRALAFRLQSILR